MGREYTFSEEEGVIAHRPRAVPRFRQSITIGRVESTQEVSAAVRRLRREFRMVRAFDSSRTGSWLRAALLMYVRNQYDFRLARLTFVLCCVVLSRCAVLRLTCHTLLTPPLLDVAGRLQRDCQQLQRLFRGPVSGDCGQRRARVGEPHGELRGVSDAQEDAVQWRHPRLGCGAW